MLEKQNLIIYVYVVCYNEEFIIPYFLKHYDFATKIYIYDNCSTDNSVEILRQDPRCEIIYFNSKFDDTINQTIKNNCWKKHRNKCDYCIVCDMDEFMWYPNNLYDKLEKSKKENIIFSLFPVRGFSMVSENNNLNKEEYLYKQIKKGYFSEEYSKTNMFSPYHILDMNYSPGSHQCKPIFINENLNTGFEIYLLHYKYIGGINRLKLRQIEYSKRISESNIENNHGKHYYNIKSIYEQYNNVIHKSKYLDFIQK